MTTDPFQFDDAAYVLGALDDEQRRAFEEHLAGCAECTERVAQVRDMPALLAGLPADVLDVDDPVPDTLLPALLRAARRARRRRLGVIGALGGLAAACLIALVLVLALPSGGSGNARTMVAVGASPVHATAALDRVSWGTEIRLVCHYDAYAEPGTYSLVVIDTSGVAHPAGSWTLTPGKVTRFTGGTALRSDQISKIEITAGSTPILALSE